ncbi:hypothetical protein BDY19DRAFT_1020953 [Irpex rosettiformis]|uniref:Uncharacterized protein n=1 Tax=Irpex rosettiformis TaxID=378272 RepID=A0ACB8TU22_9APHY|nr:hypothetical protein BDY19DRAFT_1020953 [Irpex rosettiformis]
MDPTRYIVRRGQLPPVPQFARGSSETFSRPPLDGSLNISEIYEWHAHHSPNHPLFQYLTDNGAVLTVSYKDAIQAIYRGGWLLKTALEHVQAQQKRSIIAVLSLSESISYGLTYLASERAGFTLFPISPRNSSAAVAHLLAQVDVDLLLVGREPSMQDLASDCFELLRASNLNVPPAAVMPIFSELFPANGEEAEPLPPIDYEAGDISMIMHSSGSTAFPKPIRWTFFRLITTARMIYYGEVNMTGMRIAAHSLPMYHGMGISQILWAGAMGTVIVCNRPISPPRACSPTEMLRDAYALNCDLVMCTPNFVEAWAKNPKEVEMLKQTRGILFGGGPLGKETGDHLVANEISLYSVYGCTEFGTVNTVLPKESLKDWEYFSFAEPVKVHWIPDENGTRTYKLVLMAGELCSPVVLNCEIDGVGGFNTNDLFTQHPNNPRLWKMYGRADDQIMHSIGEKTNPGPLEAILNLDKHVAHTVMFGRGRINAGVLVDPILEFKFDPRDKDKLAAFRNAIWPTVERMNRYAPQHSRVFKEMILVSLPDKPFTYTSKGAPRRHAIIDEYAPEINALYTAVEELTQVDLPPPLSWDAEETSRFVQALVTRILDQSLDDTQDFFQHGCDSLQATWIRNSLLHALRTTSDTNTKSIPFNFVYDYPTVSSLASYVASAAWSKEEGAKDTTSAIKAMDQMLEKYTQGFPVHIPQTNRMPIGDTILVTGTTGGLGCALLSQLYDASEVVKVYAVNRLGKQSLKGRQRKLLRDRGYDGDAILRSSKVVLVEADFAHPLIGLTQELYDEIRLSVTHIIHNAWPVNFNVNLGFFDPSIQGLRNLVDLALKSPQATPPRLIFVSSIGVLRHIDHAQPIKEELVNADVAVGTGYSESKWVCEQLLAVASRDTPLPSVSVRVGQIAGGDNGAWNVHEWVPSLIKSSIYLGCIPLISANVSWMNATSLSRAILEARNVAAKLSPLHLAHPRSVPWNALFEPLMTKYNLQPVPFGQWFSRLTGSADLAFGGAARGNSGINGQASSNDSDMASMISTNEVTASIDIEAHASAPSVKFDETSDVLASNPGLKLLSFFSACNDSIEASARNGHPYKEAMALPQLDITKSLTIAAKESLSQEKLKSLGPEDMLRWIGYWEGVGYLPRI